MKSNVNNSSLQLNYTLNLLIYILKYFLFDRATIHLVIAPYIIYYVKLLIYHFLIFLSLYHKK